MLDLPWDQFYWPVMTNGGEENIQVTHPLHLIHLDYLMIKVTEGGKDDHVLVIIDHFTLYTQTLVTSLQTAKCTAQALWD